MIELLERTLCSGGDLEQAKMTLLNQTNIERMNKTNEIEHDYRIATLIRECLLTEPKGSSGYAVSKGIMNRLKEKYRDPVTEKVVRKINKDIKRKVEKEEEHERIDNEKVQPNIAETE